MSYIHESLDTISFNNLSILQDVYALIDIPDWIYVPALNITPTINYIPAFIAGNKILEELGFFEYNSLALYSMETPFFNGDSAIPYSAGLTFSPILSTLNTNSCI